MSFNLQLAICENQNLKQIKSVKFKIFSQKTKMKKLKFIDKRLKSIN